jgi:hypothetical protein
MRNVFNAATIASGGWGAFAANPASALTYDPYYENHPGYNQSYGPGDSNYDPDYGYCDPSYGCPDDYYDLPLYYRDLFFMTASGTTALSTIATSGDAGSSGFMAASIAAISGADILDLR